jgi:RiboL-PSP-HEPN
MFSPLQSDIDARFEAVKSFLTATGRFGDVGATVRGLAFVQLYATYEFTVRGVVQVAIDSINAHGHRMNEIAPSLMALYLDSELSSLKDCGPRRVWDARLKIFERAFSGDVVALSNNTGPPSDGTHYRHTHLLMIFAVFGIRRLPVRRRAHYFRIDEVVNNRNQIAHGAETAADVGRRYTYPDMIHRVRQMKSVCALLVSVFDSFCADSSRHRR